MAPLGSHHSQAERSPHQGKLVMGTSLSRLVHPLPSHAALLGSLLVSKHQSNSHPKHSRQSRL